MSDINCPYCDAELDICHDDGFGYEENTKHEMRCYHCDKYFVFETSISFYYEPYTADCLNDEKHDFKPTNTFPIKYTEMKCSICDLTRKPTDEEMNQILINNKDKY